MLDTGSLIPKDPQATAWPQGIDWTDYLAEIDASETIASSSWTISGPDSALTQASASIVTGSKKTQVKLSAGTLGYKYSLINHITTSSGIEDDRTIVIRIEHQ